MKTTTILGSAAVLPLLLACAANAALFTYNWSSGFSSGSGLIPDGNAGGWSDTRQLSGITESRITDVNVTLNVSGGYNGDLYGYLTYIPTIGSGSGFAILLNRVGITGGSAFGYGDAGFVIKLDDQATQSTDVHLYQTVAGYSLTAGAEWRPDGRNIDPLSSGASFDAAGRTALLSSFNNLDPNGSWTLFFADMSSGEQSTLLSWGLQIDAVPEPVSVALAIFAALAITVKLLSRPVSMVNSTRQPLHEAYPRKTI